MNQKLAYVLPYSQLFFNFLFLLSIFQRVIPSPITPYEVKTCISMVRRVYETIGCSRGQGQEKFRAIKTRAP